MSDTNTFVRVVDVSNSAEDCRAVAEILARIGDKWSVMVIGVLANGPVRYNQVQRLVHGISQRMLTLTLKGLEQDGLVLRTVYPTVPTRVEYELTDLGRRLVVPLRALYDWVIEHRKEVEAARKQFQQTAAVRARAVPRRR